MNMLSIQFPPFAGKDHLLLFTIVSVLFISSRLFRRKTAATPLKGPPSASLITGCARQILDAEDPGAIYESWAAQYGCVYGVPRGLMFRGARKVILCDPKALAWFHARDTYTFVPTKMMKTILDLLIGNGILTATGEDHRRLANAINSALDFDLIHNHRQRRALTPAFSNASIRRLTNIFIDSAYKVKTYWENLLMEKDSNGVIEVQQWMNHVALDSIGLAGFSHHFSSMDGATSPLISTIETFTTKDSNAFHKIVFFLMQLFPIFSKLPTPRNKMFAEFKRNSTAIAEELLERARREKEGGGGAVDNSIIGLLVKSESSGSAELKTNPEEVMAQNTLVIAGFETSSVSLTWALIELCKNPEKQAKLREELEQFQDRDPTWDDFMSKLPYLDAVVHETLRLHPPVVETSRVATEDSIIPLSQSIITADGKETSSISVAKGTLVATPIACINRSETFWGPTAKQFVPERWLNLDESDVKAKELQGHRHLMTFSDGPKICLGKGFAVTEIKSVLSVLIRNFAFELPGGVDEKISIHQALVKRPKTDGMNGAKVMMKVKKLE